MPLRSADCFDVELMTNIDVISQVDDISEKKGTTDLKMVSEAETEWAQREWTIQHVLFPSMRLFFKPPNSMAGNGTFVQVSLLLDLLNSKHNDLFNSKHNDLLEHS